MQKNKMSIIYLILFSNIIYLVDHHIAPNHGDWTTPVHVIRVTHDGLRGRLKTKT
jgi:hypothetical protein